MDAKRIVTGISSAIRRGGRSAGKHAFFGILIRLTARILLPADVLRGGGPGDQDALAPGRRRLRMDADRAEGFS